jgi:hypothetical protein
MMLSLRWMDGGMIGGLPHAINDVPGHGRMTREVMALAPMWA